MGVVDSLARMQHDAIERLRAGEHNDFLVAFLTTSLMLELSNLITDEPSLADYTNAVVETMTQHAPIDRCLLGVEADGLPPASAAIGFDQEFVQRYASLPESPDRCSIDLDGATIGTLFATDVPAPLQQAGFIQHAAEQISGGISHIIEAERERRRGAVARALGVVALLGGDWGEQALNDISSALASLPDATGSSVSAEAARFAGTITGTFGRSSSYTEHRQFLIDGRIEVNIDVHHVAEPGPEHLARLDEIVTALSNSLDRIEQNIRLLAEAETDQLTGVGNRRRAGKTLSAAKSMADRQNLPMAVLLCDLDWFKAINDNYGHEVGDQVLVAFADLLQRSVRAFDTVIRWGGEEFLIILPTCAQTDAQSVAERLIRDCPLANESVLPANVRQTVSIGIAVYPDTANSPETLVRAADDAMYRAKREGRDRFVLATN